MQDSSEFLNYISTFCKENNHQLCQDSDYCALLGNSNLSSIDINKIYRSDLTKPRLEEWKTSSLILDTQKGIKSLPTPSSSIREIKITSSLGELSSRGILADWLVRTCLKPELTLHLSILAAHEYYQTMRGTVSRTKIPIVEPLMRLIDKDIPEEFTIDQGILLILSHALNGEAGIFINNWILEASIIDLINWNFDSYQPDPPTSLELVPDCGIDGINWIYDRFTKTYIDEWSPTSYIWELSFINDPDEVATSIDIDKSEIMNRIISLSDILKSANTRSIYRKILPLSLGENISIISDVLHRIDKSLYEDAATIAERHHLEREDPNSNTLYLFCLVGSNPTLCLSKLSDAKISHTVRHILEISCYLALNKPNEIINSIAASNLHDERDQDGLFWEPDSLTTSSPKTIQMNLKSWINKVLSLI